MNTNYRDDVERARVKLELQEERLAATRNRARIAKEWASAFDIKIVKRPFGQRHARYSVINRWIESPFPPNTNTALFKIAEQIANVHHSNGGSRPPYIEAYERFHFAQSLFEGRGIRVNRKITHRAQMTVYELVKREIRDSDDLIDRSIAMWAEVSVPAARLSK